MMDGDGDGSGDGGGNGDGDDDAASVGMLTYDVPCAALCALVLVDSFRVVIALDNADDDESCAGPLVRR